MYYIILYINFKILITYLHYLYKNVVDELYLLYFDIISLLRKFFRAAPIG